MKILACQEHEKRIADLEESVDSLLSAMSVVVEAMRTTHQSATTLTGLFQEFKEGQASTPPETTPGEPYHR